MNTWLSDAIKNAERKSKIELLINTIKKIILKLETCLKILKVSISYCTEELVL